MSTFKSLGQAIHVTDDDFSVVPVVEVNLADPQSSTIVTYLICDPDGKPILAATDRDTAIAEAEEVNQSTEPGLP